MAKSDFMPNDDNGKADLFVHFRDTVGSFLGTLGILGTDPDITGQAEDATYFRALVDLQQTMQTGAQGWTAWKNYERDGGSATVETPLLPVFPGTFPDAVPPGIVGRFRALVKRIKACKNYTPAIGQALGIEGPDHAGPDMATVTPVITLTLQGNAVFIGWGWQGYSAFLDMCELQVDRADGKGWGLLAFDTTPNYTDTTALPATPVKWKYRAIYRVGDHQVGQWSNTVEITVGG